MNWTIQQLVKATDGKMISVDENLTFSSISTDSRSLEKGALYVAIKGDVFDGHQFIEQAFENGAVAVLVSTEKKYFANQIKVADTRVALGKFASWHRQQMKLKKLVAVTGSNGKTTCKNMLQHILVNLTSENEVLATEGNLNNDFGVPRTLLKIQPNHKYAVIEMGANHPREIDYVSQLAKPDVALITIAAAAHLEGFGSLEGVIQTKAEIMNGLAKGSTIVLNADSAGFDTWQQIASEKSLNIVSFGSANNAEFKLIEFTQNQASLSFDFEYKNKQYQAKLPILGKHNALNALACIAVCIAMEAVQTAEIAKILTPLGTFYGVNGRLQPFTLPNGSLLDDSYNANPDSMKAAIDALVSLPAPHLFCMGEMAEIGGDAAQQHILIAQYAKQAGVQYLLCTGKQTKPLSKIFGEGATWYENKQSLATKAVKLITTKQVNNCLVKGSRSAKMEEVATQILQGVAEC